jgi:hypothetical protein
MWLPRHSFALYTIPSLLLLIGCSRATIEDASTAEPANPLGNVVRFEIEDFDAGQLPQQAALSGYASPENQATLNRSRDLALRQFPDGSWINFGPDASYRTIRLFCQNGTIELSSWHPIAEMHPNVVAASYGLTSLDGQSREEFLDRDKGEYLVKRDAFDAIQHSLMVVE